MVSHVSTSLSNYLDEHLIHWFSWAYIHIRFFKCLEFRIRLANSKQGSTAKSLSLSSWEWSGGAMVLGKLPVPGRPTIWMIVGQGPIALAAGADGGCLDIFSLHYPFSHLLPLSGGRPDID